ncbi:hypothetical protein [Brevundimonas sp.]|uniref:hypothetical protein n=1 Tax=Brevundimonas sp. TaxID=1871086 RepID=UPI003567138A
MSDAPLVNMIVRRLKADGYEDVTTPFQVASVSFNFTAALRGSDGRALDLILIVDTTTGDFGDRDIVRVRQRIEALSRALDVTGSRYVLTAVLAGAVLTGEVEVLAETCRVLTIGDIPINAAGDPDGDAAALLLDDRLRVLLSLDLPLREVGAEDSNGGAVDLLIAALSGDGDQDLLTILLEAAEAGEEAVADAMGQSLNQALMVEAAP